MPVLAIDTAASLCAACTLDASSDEELAREVRDIGKGHAEKLMDVVEAALKAANVQLAGLSMIAVTIGPGSFTGVRLGVSAARGFSLALGVPAVGVTTLEALARETAEMFPGRPVLAAIGGGRGQLYIESLEADGRSTGGPRMTTFAEASDIVTGNEVVLCGSAASELADAVGRRFDLGPVAATADIATYARIAARRGLPGLPPRPLYLRDAVATPQEGFALPRRPGA